MAMEPLESKKKQIIYIIISLAILLFLLFYFVIPGNVIPDRAYKGGGSPFVNTPRG